MNDPVVQLADCDVIKCSNCEKDLMIIKNKSDLNNTQKSFNISSKIQVSCPFCDDNSFVFETKGVFMYHPAPGIKIKGAIPKNDVMYFSTSR